MVRSEGLEGVLDMKDPAVRYFLNRPSSRKAIPEKYLGVNKDGEPRSQREAREVGSKVRFALRSLQERELFLKAEAKRESQERAKQEADKAARLEAELAEMKAKQLDQRRETIKLVVEKNKALKALKAMRLGIIKACASSKPKPAKKVAPRPLFKADGRPCLSSTQVPSYA